jgi:hypothetical protein
MRRIVLIIAPVMSLAVITIVAPSDAAARFGAGAIADRAAAVSSVQPAQSYGTYSGSRTQHQPFYAPGYEPRSYAAPSFSAPSSPTLGYAPRYRAPEPLPSYINPTSRDALNNCFGC